MGNSESVAPASGDDVDFAELEARVLAHYEKVTLKWYRCECGTEFKIETNHWGRIYRGCNPVYDQRFRTGRTYIPHRWADCIHAEKMMVEMARDAEHVAMIEADIDQIIQEFKGK